MQDTEMAAVKEVQTIAMFFMMKEYVIVMRIAIEPMNAVQIYSLYDAMVNDKNTV